MGGRSDSQEPPGEQAATVMLVRDGHRGVEVLMVQRAAAAAVAAGLYVFPGGKLDATDGAADVAALCDGLGDADASGRLGVPAGGLAFWVAAVRECFEEVGVLFARRHGAAGLVRTDGAFTDRYDVAREGFLTGRLGMAELCRRDQLRIAADRLHYVARWITPFGAPRRFDTRFFVAAAPDGQMPRHDAAETIGHAWVRPIEALEGRLCDPATLMAPTRANLAMLAMYPTTVEVLEAAAQVVAPPPIQPRLRRVDGKVVGVVLPGEDGYEGLS